MSPRWGPRSPQDRSKTGPRAIKKSCIFRLDFCLVLGSSWGRFGSYLGIQNRPKIARAFGNFRPLVVLISILRFDGPKMAAKTVSRGSKSPQERTKTPPRPSQEGPRPPQDGPRPPQEPSWDGLGGHLGTNRSQDRKPVAPSQWSSGSRGRFWLPKWVPKRPQDDPKTSQKSRQKMHDFLIALGPVLDRS